MDKLNPRLVRNLTLAAAAVCLVTSLLTLIFGWKILLVGPLSMALLLLGIGYSVWQRRRAGLVSRGYFRVMIALLLAGVALNLMAAVSQFMLMGLGAS